MPAAFSLDVYRDDMARVVQSVFQTMMNLEVAPSDAPWTPSPDTITAAVLYVGEWRGATLVECAAQQACQFAVQFMGIEMPAAIDDDVRDVMGELANMAAGNLKSLLPRGVDLSIPSVVEGSGLHPARVRRGQRAGAYDLFERQRQFPHHSDRNVTAPLSAVRLARCILSPCPTSRNIPRARSCGSNSEPRIKRPPRASMDRSLGGTPATCPWGPTNTTPSSGWRSAIPLPLILSVPSVRVARRRTGCRTFQSTARTMRRPAPRKWEGKCSRRLSMSSMRDAWPSSRTLLARRSRCGKRRPIKVLVSPAWTARCAGRI